MNTPTPLADIVRLLDEQLNTQGIKDAPVALNGLQIENRGSVTRVALAVDASQKSIDAALAGGADLLIVHHGLFWSGLRPLTGWWKKKLCTCLEGNLAVYSAHLPLDLHPTLGNNACLARGLGLSDIEPDIDYHGTRIGLGGCFEGTLAELRARLAALTGAEVKCVAADDSAPAGRVAVCSGGAAGEIYQVAELGYDTYISGEDLHWAATTAEDMGLNLLLAGHYATETFGVKELGRLLEREFGLPTFFIDNPTGM